MRYSDAAPTRRISLAVVAALLATLVFAVAASAMPDQPLAPSVPNGPHCFYGTVMTDRGVTLPGATVVAQAVAGYWTGQLSSVSDSMSRYGYTPTFCIPGYESGSGTGAKTGDLIGFKVNGVQARLYEVATGKLLDAYTYPFSYYGSTELNLIVPLQVTITATAGSNGAIDPAGTVLVDYGQNQTFTFHPATGYQVEKVWVDGQENGEAKAAGSYTFTNVRSSRTIHVEFIQSIWDITATPGVGCTITPSGVRKVPVHTDITFAVGAQTGYRVVDVLVDGASKGVVTSVSFTNVIANHTVSATCEKIPFTITPTWGTGGTIVPGTPQTVLYGEDSVTFEIKADMGYAIEDVVVNGTSKGAISSYKFVNVTADGAIAAKFKPSVVTGFKLYIPMVFR